MSISKIKRGKLIRRFYDVINSGQERFVETLSGISGSLSIAQKAILVARYNPDGSVLRGMSETRELFESGSTSKGYASLSLRTEESRAFRTLNLLNKALNYYERFYPGYVSSKRE